MSGQHDSSRCNWIHYSQSPVVRGGSQSPTLVLLVLGYRVVMIPDSEKLASNTMARIFRVRPHAKGRHFD